MKAQTIALEARIPELLGLPCTLERGPGSGDGKAKTGGES